MLASPATLPGRPALATVLALALALAACGGDDDGTTPPVDAATGIDAPSACALPSAVITCTEGNDAPCTAVCDTAYCHNFSQLGVVCTKACTVVGDCPSGWSCNMMGRCRPPT